MEPRDGEDCQPHTSWGGRRDRPQEPAEGDSACDIARSDFRPPDSGVSVRGWLSAAQVLVLCYVRSAGRESHGSFLCTQLCLPSNSYVDTLSPKGLYVEMGVFGMVTGLSEVISAGP